MISIFRNGPKLIVFESHHIESLTGILINHLNAVATNLDSAFEMADEDNTIIFLAEPDKKDIHIEDIKATLFISLSYDDFFSSIINLKATRYVDYSYIFPGLLIMRTVGNSDKIIKAVAETYHGDILSFHQCLNKGISSQTIISFTQKPVNRRLSLKDMEENHVLIDMDVHKLCRSMRNQVLRFFNEGFEDKHWYDVQIKIYDRYSKYMTHLERLLLILNSLDVGLILGESWSKDHPRFLMSVLVYEIRLFTLLNPIELKKILLALEYLDDGTRIIDLDLIHKGNKVSWHMALEKNPIIKARNELGKLYRTKLINDLTSEDKEKLFSIEKEIIASRY